jgi:hypothetical protein
VNFELVSWVRENGGQGLRVTGETTGKKNVFLRAKMIMEDSRMNSELGHHELDGNTKGCVLQKAHQTVHVWECHRASESTTCMSV